MRPPAVRSRVHVRGGQTRVVRLLGDARGGCVVARARAGPSRVHEHHPLDALETHGRDEGAEQVPPRRAAELHDRRRRAAASRASLARESFHGEDRGSRATSRDSGIGRSAPAIARIGPAVTSSGSTDPTRPGPRHSSRKAVRRSPIRTEGAYGTSIPAASWSNTATMRATWAIRSGFPTDLSCHWASGKTGARWQDWHQSVPDRHANDGSPSHHSNGNR